jgi:predicted PurR-regulated permease PerM
MSFLNKKWFKFMLGFIMFLIIVLLLNENRFLLTPIIVLVQTIFFPFVLAGVLFYLCRPLVKWLEKQKVPSWIAILIAYIAIILFVSGVITLIGPLISDQLNRFIENLPAMISVVMDTIQYVQDSEGAIPTFINDMFINFSTQFEEILKNNISNITNSITGIFSFIGGLFNTVMYLVLVPFILFYMLKDHTRFVPSVLVLFPESRREHVQKILSQVDKAISSYIQGQLLVGVIVGTLLYIGYLIIGLNYSLVLALFGMFTNVIPFFGPFIAVIPAFLVALFQEPVLAIYVAIVMVIAQQIEGNVISPHVMGKTLSIHPLTIITLVLTSGSLFGILGVILIIPSYAILKILVIHTVKLYRID